MDVIYRQDLLGVELWLPVRQAVAFLRDPAAAQAEVRRALRRGQLDPESGRRLKPKPGGRMAAKLGPRTGADDDFNQHDQRPPGAIVDHSLACTWPGCGKVCRGRAGLRMHMRAHERRG